MLSARTVACVITILTEVQIAFSNDSYRYSNYWFSETTGWMHPIKVSININLLVENLRVLLLTQ